MLAPGRSMVLFHVLAIGVGVGVWSRSLSYFWCPQNTGAVKVVQDQQNPLKHLCTQDSFKIHAFPIKVHYTKYSFSIIFNLLVGKNTFKESFLDCYVVICFGNTLAIDVVTTE